MVAYDIFFKESVWKDLGNVPINDIGKIISKIGKLGDDPRPADCEKLTRQELYRIRQGNYRIVLSIQDNELTVWGIRAGHRNDVYP
jgi:mRNA interferase RelE/StbE